MCCGGCYTCSGLALTPGICALLCPKAFRLRCSSSAAAPLPTLSLFLSFFITFSLSAYRAYISIQQSGTATSSQTRSVPGDSSAGKRHSMLGSLDAATGDALRSFQNALDRAQQLLQRDDERFKATAQLLRDLTIEVDCLKADSAPHSITRQRREALQAEKLKMLHHTRHQREAIAETAAHIQHLQEPRVRLSEQVDALKGDVKALRRQYGLRAAQVHAFIAQFLQPQNNLENLRFQLAQLQQGRVAQAESVKAAKRLLEERKTDLAALQAAGRVDATVCPNVGVTACNRHSSPVKGGNNGSAVSTLATGSDEEQRSDESEECAATTLLTEAERRAEAARRRSEQVAAHKAAEMQQGAEEARLEALRANLRRQVLLLCQEIEEVDAAQQREQKAYHDALNDAASGSGAGLHQQCQRCTRDLFDGFS
ncbi:hypothetical protein LSCM4_03223 [Leishmania orientalis]|uniref:Uncharacterized protein n=1 Tax=Leishmania orientalis TaxID=2249476 RepID=A0A836H649_9TRYP|nr:hypothetical protein LSCM4_03223 [Leishmania orientalis]